MAYSEENSQVVADLYELAFMPGQFRCPQCDFHWSIQTICVATGRVGTTEENRQTPDCPNDGTRMVCVTYREQLEAYAARLKQEFDARDAFIADLRNLQRQWIACSERLPEKQVMVLVSNPEWPAGFPVVMMGHLDGLGGWCGHYADQTMCGWNMIQKGLPTQDPTHWQPLPAPPASAQERE